MAPGGIPGRLAAFGYCIILLLSLVARGEDPSRGGTKGKEFIFVKAADLAAGVSAEARFDGLIALDLETLKLRTVAGTEVVAGAISPDGRWLLCTHRDKAVVIAGTSVHDLR